MKICVYLASSRSVDQKYFEATKQLAKLFVAHNIEVVYGGGSVGLMGQLADTVIDEGGKIKGIIPHFMRALEWDHSGVKDMEYVETMHQRKAKLVTGIDGLVTMAGGSGTMEEFFETLTMKRLGQFTKPMIILNTDGFYDPLQNLLDKMIDQSFMNPIHKKMYRFVTKPEEVIPALNAAPEWSADAIDYAAVKK